MSNLGTEIKNAVRVYFEPVVKYPKSFMAAALVIGGIASYAINEPEKFDRAYSIFENLIVR